MSTVAFSISYLPQADLIDAGLIKIVSALLLRIIG
jgi:uncharacterized membrane protein